MKKLPYLKLLYFSTGSNNEIIVEIDYVDSTVWIIYFETFNAACEFGTGVGIDFLYFEHGSNLTVLADEIIPLGNITYNLDSSLDIITEGTFSGTAQKDDGINPPEMVPVSGSFRL